MKTKGKSKNLAKKTKICTLFPNVYQDVSACSLVAAPLAAESGVLKADSASGGEHKRLI